MSNLYFISKNPCMKKVLIPVFAACISLFTISCGADKKIDDAKNTVNDAVGGAKEVVGDAKDAVKNTADSVSALADSASAVADSALNVIKTRKK